MEFQYFWEAFNKDKNIFTELLDHFHQSPTNTIIMSCFGPRTLPKTTKKIIYWVGENHRPNPNAHFNLTFDPDSPTNIRLPLWFLYHISKNSQGHDMGTFNPNYSDHPTSYPPPHIRGKVEYRSGLPREKFCAYVSSHGGVRFRDKLVKQVSAYKPVDCGGINLNNQPNGPVKDKIAFQQQYKFCIAAECSKQPGYVTEKILDAYKSGCIPIYRGAPDIEEDFNKETFINANNITPEELVRVITSIDKTPALYESYFNKPIFTKKWIDILHDPTQQYLKNICEKIAQPLNF